MKNESQVERIVIGLLVSVGVSASWFFRLELSEGWDIGYFAFLMLLVGILMGIEIGKHSQKSNKRK
jgi:uncharacterized membrane protein YjjP (DUF1212 family)